LYRPLAGAVLEDVAVEADLLSSQLPQTTSSITQTTRRAQARAKTERIMLLLMVSGPGRQRA